MVFGIASAMAIVLDVAAYVAGRVGAVGLVQLRGISVVCWRRDTGSRYPIPADSEHVCNPVRRGGERWDPPAASAPVTGVKSNLLECGVV